jgi:hypothetical protein
MENGDKCVEKKETTLNSVLTGLEEAIAVAGRNADKYRTNINKFDTLYLESDKNELKSVAGQLKDVPESDTFLFKLKTLVTRLNASNQKNNEILEHLNDLI